MLGFFSLFVARHMEKCLFRKVLLIKRTFFARLQLRISCNIKMQICIYSAVYLLWVKLKLELFVRPIYMIVKVSLASSIPTNNAKMMEHVGFY